MPTRRSRAPEVVAEHLETDVTCHLCNGMCDGTDMKWLCLCTPEPRRVHRKCAVIRGAPGQSNKWKKCPHCDLENMYEPLTEARAAARVIVIGAGPAGLAAARYLADRGLRPLVVEARSRLGGRIETVEVGGNPIDLGAAYIHGCDESYNAVRLQLRRVARVRVRVRVVGGAGARGPARELSPSWRAGVRRPFDWRSSSASLPTRRRAATPGAGARRRLGSTATLGGESRRCAPRAPGGGGGAVPQAAAKPHPTLPLNAVCARS